MNKKRKLFTWSTNKKEETDDRFDQITTEKKKREITDAEPMNEKGLLRSHDQYILFLFFVSFQWLFLRFLTISFRLFIHFISKRKKEKCVDFVYEFGKEIYIKKRKEKNIWIL